MASSQNGRGADRAIPARDPGVRFVGWAPCRRAALLQGTALRAAALAVLAGPAMAQIAPSARPAGGVVVGGVAGISQSTNATTINQSSERAAINWQSFNVGSQQTVTFKQPNSSAIALNTVIGPNPSEIAGHINANGQVVIVNQSGVVFDHGAQVDTAGLVVSAAGITTKNFMAGHMVFDQAAHAGARIANNGTITIAQAGLASLVAPQVSNAGLIQARLGRVILGGAATYTLDLYGDGLLALNVTGQVTGLSLGGKTVPALVTNIGTIVADGGTVLLSAQAADGLIRTLVSAGGTIATNTVGSSTGRVLVQGIGGSVEIDGAVSATGLAAGTTGGQVVADATGSVTVGAGATIDASGDAGGGLIALGTTTARAAGGPKIASSLTAQSTTVAAGARLSANAGRRGNGGHITLLSTGTTSLAGAISVLGGSASGNGGQAEVSGATVALTGLVNAGAAHGRLGGLLIDPTNIYVADGNPATGSGDQAITPATLEDENANITLAATNAVDFAYSNPQFGAAANTLNLGTHNLTVTAGAGGINVDGGFTIEAGTVSFAAGAVSFDTALGAGLRLGPASAAASTLAATAITLTGTTGIALSAASVTGTNTVALASSGGSIDGTGVITTADLAAGAGGGVSLTGANAIAALGTVTAVGDIVIDNAQALSIGGSLTSSGGGSVALSATGLTIEAPITTAGSLSLTAIAGNIAEIGSGLIDATFLSGSAAAGGGAQGQAVLTASNTVGTVTGFTTTGNFSLTDGPGDVLIVYNGRAGGNAISAGSTGSPAILSLTAPILEFASVVTAPGGTIALRADNFGFSQGSTNLLVTGSTGLVGVDSDTATQLNISGFAADVQTGELSIGSLNAQTPSSHLSVINLQGALDLTGQAGTLGLFTNATGNIEESTLGTGTGSSGITASVLVGNAGTVTLLSGNDRIGSIGDFDGRSFALSVKAGALSVTGTLNGGALADITSLGNLTVSGAVVAASTTLIGANLTVSGSASAASALDLGATAGTISVPGSLTASILTGSATGSAALTGSNAVQALGDFTAPTLVLDDTGRLAVTGQIDGNVVNIGTTGSLTVSGTLTAGVTTLSGTAIDIPGTIVAASQVSLDAITGGIAETGALTAPLLTGSAAGAASFSGVNDVTDLGDFTAAGFSFAQADPLSVTGTVAGGTATSIVSKLLLSVNGSVTGSATSLTGANLTLASGSSVSGSNAVTLAASSGSISALGTLSTPLLTGSAPGSATLTGTNQIAALGDFSAAALTLNDAPDLAVTGIVSTRGSVAITDTGTLTLGGSITAASASFDGAAIDVTGSITGSTLISLSSAGTIGETGSLISPLLTGTSDGAATLTGSNTLTGLGNFNTTTGSFAAAQGFFLNDTGGLTVSGTVDGGPTIAIAATGALTLTSSITANTLSLQGASLNLAGGIDAPTALSLIATGGGITESGSVTTPLLSGSATGSAALTGSNSITTLGNFNAGSLALDDAQALTVSGSVAAGTTALSATAITITGSITGSAALNLVATAGSIVDGGGNLTTGLLTGSSSDYTYISSDGTTSVGTLGNFAAGSSFQLIDGASLSVTGAVSAVNGMYVQAASLSLSGSLSGGGSYVELQAQNGSIRQTGGGISANELDSFSSGSATLTAANAVDNLTFEATGGFTLNDSADLTVDFGSVTPGTAAPAFIGLRAPSITVIQQETTVRQDGRPLDATNPSLSAQAGTIDLSTNSLILQAGVSTGTTGLIGLATYSSGPLTLTSLNAAQLLTGELSVGSLDGATPSPLVTAVDLPNGLDLTGIAGTLGLFTASGGRIASTGGITAATLIGNAGTVGITGANTITTIGNFTAQSFAFAQAGAVDVTGTVNGGALATIASQGDVTVDGAVIATATALNGTGLTINGSATGSATLNLAATAGRITADNGTLTTALLTGSATGDALLDGTNIIGTLGNFSTPFFDLHETGNLAVSGAVSVNNVQIEAAAITLTGSITAVNSAALIADTGSIDAASGSVASPNLYVSAAGSAVFSGSNAVGTLTFDSTGSFVLNDSIQLVVDDSETDADASGAAPQINLRAPTLIVTFFDEGIAPARPARADFSPQFASQAGLTAPGGTISLSADTMTLDAGVTTGASGLVGLATYGGHVLTLTSGTAAEITTGELSVGSLDGVTPSPLVTTINLPSALNLTGDASTLGLFTAPGGSVTSSQGITAGTLVGNAGTVSLTGPNSIATLGDFTAQSLTYAQAGDIFVGGTLNGGALVSLSTQGSLRVAGAVAAQTTSLTAGTELNISGSVTGTASLSLESGSAARNVANGGIIGSGSVNAGLLTGGGDSVVLTGTNKIAQLGNFAATGGVTLTLADSENLVITGSVTGGQTSISAPSIAISGSILGSDSLALTALNGSITGAGALTAGALTLAAPTGGIAETGVISAATLSGSALGSVALTGANSIASLGDFSASGFSLADTGDLAVSGTLSGGTATSLQTGGALTLESTSSVSGSATALGGASLMLGGTLNAPTSLSLTASAGDITSTGTIGTALLRFIAPGSVSLAGNTTVAALGTSSAGSLTLNDLAALYVQGAVTANTATITDIAGLTIAGILTAPTARLTATTIALPGTLTDTASLDLVATAGGISGAGPVTTALLTGSASGGFGLTGANQITGLGDFTAAGFSLQDASALAVSGTVNGGASASLAASGALSVPGSIAASSVALSGASLALTGSIAAPTSLALTASGNILSTGALSTAALSGTAGGAISLSGNNAIAAVSDVSATAFLLDDTGALSVAGQINAGQTILQAASITVPGTIASTAANSEILMDAPGDISLSGTLSAATIQIGGALPAATSSAPVAAAASVVPQEVILDGGTFFTGTASGLSVTADSFVQSGITRVNPDGGAAAIAITLAGTQGSASFAPQATEGLIARSSTLLLNLQYGTASGNVDVGGLTVTYAAPAAITVSNLTGSIGGINGAAAAAHGVASPAVSAQYKFNGCAIGATLCSAQVAPVTSQDTINAVPIFVDPAAGGPNNAVLASNDYGFGFGESGDLAGTPASQAVQVLDLMAPFSQESDSKRRRRHDEDLIIPNISSEDF